jgi:hypothetical protein
MTEREFLQELVKDIPKHYYNHDGLYEAGVRDGLNTIGKEIIKYLYETDNVNRPERN